MVSFFKRNKLQQLLSPNLGFSMPSLKLHNPSVPARLTCSVFRKSAVIINMSSWRTLYLEPHGDSEDANKSASLRVGNLLQCQHENVHAPECTNIDNHGIDLKQCWTLICMAPHQQFRIPQCGATPPTFATQ